MLLFKYFYPNRHEAFKGENQAPDYYTATTLACVPQVHLNRLYSFTWVIPWYWAFPIRSSVALKMEPHQDIQEENCASLCFHLA